MDTSSDDSVLLKDCLSGDEEAWYAFVNRFSKLVYYSITKTVGPYVCNLDQEDIEDIYSGVFHSLIENNYKKLRTFEGKKGCTLTSWVRLIAVRHTIDFLRKRREFVSIDDDTCSVSPFSETLRDNTPSVHNQIETFEHEKIVKQAIEALPSSDRLFVTLYYIKELTPEEIADIMHVTVSTVYSKNNRIREKLEKILKSKGHIA